MTVSTTTARDEYTGNGVTTAFTVTFEFNTSSELKVYQAGTLKTLTTHYTVSGGSGAGGTVTFVTAPANGELVVILDDPAVTQATDYVANDPFPAASHEAALDKLTRLVRRLKDRLDRAATLADGVTDITPTLPTPSAGRALVWNSSADGLENGPTATEITSAQTYATAAAASATAAAAALDEFTDLYLGRKTSDPALDNDGNALQVGAFYFNTADGILRIYNSALAWQDATSASTVTVTTQLFSGDGADTTFTLSAAPAALSLLWVSVGGVDQRPTTDYTLSGTTLTFTTAPPLGTNNISVRWISQVAAAVPNDGSVTTAKLDPSGVAVPNGSTATTQSVGDNSTKLATTAYVDRVSAPLLGAFNNLALSANGANATVSVTATELVVESSSNTYKTLRTVSLAIDTSTSGANGLDTGTIGASTWYSVWVIAKDDGTTAGLISASATAPTLPETYTHKARVGWVRTDGTANKYPLGFKQSGRSVRYQVAAASNLTALPVMASGNQGTYAQTSAPTWQAVAVANFAPTTAGEIDLVLCNNYNNGALANLIAAPNNAYSGMATTAPPPLGLTGVGCLSVAGALVLESTNIYVAQQNAGAATLCAGWEDNL